MRVPNPKLSFRSSELIINIHDHFSYSVLVDMGIIAHLMTRDGKNFVIVENGKQVLNQEDKDYILNIFLDYLNS